MLLYSQFTSRFTALIPRLKTSRSLLSKSFVRKYSVDNSKEEIEKAQNWLKSFTPSQIPPSVFEVSYSRSSGPGGQKVNKTSSKATISMEADQWLNTSSCYWIPQLIRQQIAVKKIRYESKNGGVVIQSDSSRNRDLNTIECYKKLLAEIKANVYFEGETSEEDIQKWDEIKDERKEARLFNKKKKSDKKKLRSKSIEW